MGLAFLESKARFSLCRKYRYELWRVWDKEKPYCAFICLNPSTADEIQNDPTVTRCINYAYDWGYGGLCMLNIFAYRTTNPRIMKSVDDPVGPENNRTIQVATYNSGISVAAWGTHGIHHNRNYELLCLMRRELYCLGTTKKGHPKHPLYLKKDLQPILFSRCHK